MRKILLLLFTILSFSAEAQLIPQESIKLLSDTLAKFKTITSASSDSTALRGLITTNTGNISSNTSNISTNTSNISSNASRIIADSLLMVTANAKITSLIADSAFQASKILLNTRPYTTYEAFLTQSATSAPSATRMDTNFSGVTFTWARTSSGVYTITASSAIFTASKTAIMMSRQTTNSLQSFNAVTTSTTVVTLTTTLSSVVATVLTALGTDVLLNNTLIEIRIYN